MSIYAHLVVAGVGSQPGRCFRAHGSASAPNSDGAKALDGAPFEAASTPAVNQRDLLFCSAPMWWRSTAWHTGTIDGPLAVLASVVDVPSFP